MTSPSRRKHRITVRLVNWVRTIACSAIVLGWAGASMAQNPPPNAPLVAPSNPLDIRPGESSISYSIQLEPPGPERLFRLESEDAMKERMRQEKRNTPQMERLVFPEEIILSRSNYDSSWRSRNWQTTVRLVEPNYLVHGRLLFHEKNSERYGWDLGPIQPFVSAGFFLGDMALLPYHLATDPFRRWESNAGYGLPGDPVPYMLYPIGASSTGSVAEAAVVFALLACFP